MKSHAVNHGIFTALFSLALLGALLVTLYTITIPVAAAEITPESETMVAAYYSGEDSSSCTQTDSLETALTHANANDDITIVLLRDVTVTTLLKVTNSLTLDLNGYGITYNGTSGGSFITVDAADKSFTLKDSNPTRNASDPEVFTNPTGGADISVTGGYLTSNHTNSAGVSVDAGTFILQSGTIVGFSRTSAIGSAGVYVGSSGTFTMTGGRIVGNTTKGSGAGVYLAAVSSGGSATVTMSGGEISYNLASGSSSNGGGVYVGTGVAFTMSGDSEISYNLASGSSSNGGGIYVQSDATFTMRSGSVTYNTTKGNGGGVYVGTTSQTSDFTVFEMTTGKISHNTASGNGGGVYFSLLSYNKAIMERGEINQNTAQQGGGVYLISGIYASFTLGGEINKNTAQQGGGVYTYGSNTTIENLYMNGGTITGNILTGEEQKGGGVYLHISAFLMTAGAICDNHSDTTASTASTAYGGGIYLNDNSQCIITSGTITDNSVSASGESAGGGIYLTSYTALFMGKENQEAATLIITDNTAAAVASNVYIGSNTGRRISFLSSDLTCDIGISAKSDLFSNDALTISTASSKITGTLRSDLTNHLIVETEITSGATAGKYTYTLQKAIATVTYDGATTYHQSVEDAMSKAMDCATTADKQATVTLYIDVTITKPLTVAADSYIILDLNDCSVLYEGDENNPVIYVTEKGHFTLTDNNPTTAREIAGTTVTGGYLSGGTGYLSGDGNFLGGGGVYVAGGTTAGDTTAGDTTFTMNGGNIVGNTLQNKNVLENNSNQYLNADLLGAGVCLSGAATFTMNGGSILYNTAKQTYEYDVSTDSNLDENAKMLYVAGVSVSDSAICSLQNGTITNNTATVKIDTARPFGGVYFANTATSLSLAAQADSGIITITDNQSIAPSTPSATTNLCLAQGATVALTNALTAQSALGITLESGTGTFTTVGAQTTGFTADNTAYAVKAVAGSATAYELAPAVATVCLGEVTTRYASIEDAVAAATEATTTEQSPATITLLADVTTTNTLIIRGDTSGEAVYVRLDLAGYGITLAIADSDTDKTQAVINAAGCSSFTLLDSSAATPSTQRTHYAYFDETNFKYVVTDDLETATEKDAEYLTFTGGYITGGTDSGIKTGYYYIIEITTNFVMQSGTIVGNCADNSSGGAGGGISSNGDGTMVGGSIMGNTAKAGAGVYVGSEDFTLSGTASITNNKASENGGGVYVAAAYETSNFTMADTARIADNSAPKGSSVYLLSSLATFALSGAPVIEGDVYLPTAVNGNFTVPHLTLRSALTSTTPIAIATEDTVTASAPITIVTAGSDYTLTESDLACFTKADTTAPGGIVLDADTGTIQLMVYDISCMVPVSASSTMDYLPPKPSTLAQP